MLVVSRGSSGAVHVFRGDMADRFLTGLHFADHVGDVWMLIRGRRVMFVHLKSPAGGDICCARDEWITDELAAASILSIVDGRAKKAGSDAPN